MSANHQKSGAPARARVFEAVSDRIRADIADGTLKPGDKLPPEREISETLGCSRSAVREALRALEAGGLLQLKKGVAGGAFVKVASGAAVGQGIRDLFLLRSVPPMDLLEVRLMILPRAALLACHRADADDFRRLEDNIQETEKALSDDYEIDRVLGNFYKILGGASKNYLLSILVDSLCDATMRFAEDKGIIYSDRVLEMRWDILRCIMNRDHNKAVNAVKRQLLFAHQSNVSMNISPSPDDPSTTQGAADAHPSRHGRVIAGAEALDAVWRSLDEGRETFLPRVTAARGATTSRTMLEEENLRLRALLADAMLELSYCKQPRSTES